MYLICWDGLVIGKIYQKDELYRYYPNYDNIEEAEKSGLPRAIFIHPQLEWGEMPPYFKSRIEQDPDLKNNCKSNGDLLTITKFEKK
jgi:hypothetical protein